MLRHLLKLLRQLEADIRRQESLYTTAGGLETTLQDLRDLKTLKYLKELYLNSLLLI